MCTIENPEHIVIAKTDQTPKSIFNLADGYISLEGKIVAENPLEYFDRLNRWIEEYVKSGNTKPLVVDLTLDYFNTVASKMLSKFFIKLIEHNAVINWYHEPEDEEIKEAGEDYKIMLNYDINILERKV
ncbi:MAG: DUF1987 domain-containing protein [Bacteroidia bacterium]